MPRRIVESDHYSGGSLSGLLPAVPMSMGPTRICAACATLIRFHPTEGVWRHAALGMDHAPELRGSWPPQSERDAPIVTESELRLLDGNR